MKKLIILPSYNEKDNIILLIQDIININKNYFVCVVDDNSPDGTLHEIKNFLKELDFEDQKRIHLIVREQKDGRGSAVRVGIEWGLQSNNNFGSFVEMDCDFSHSPSDIEKGLKLLKEADVVIGSRYPNGKIIGWSMNRKVVSYLSNILIRALLSWNVYDYTNGFRFYSRRAAEIMCQIPQRHKGYIYLSETLAILMKNLLVIESFPITFINRRKGKSNTNMKEVLSSINGIFSISWRYWFVHQD